MWPSHCSLCFCVFSLTVNSTLPELSCYDGHHKETARICLKHRIWKISSLFVSDMSMFLIHIGKQARSLFVKRQILVSMAILAFFQRCHEQGKFYCCLANPAVDFGDGCNFFLLYQQSWCLFS